MTVMAKGVRCPRPLSKNDIMDFWNYIGFDH